MLASHRCGRRPIHGAGAPGDTVVVIGTGGVGLNVVQGARLSNAGQVIAIDRDEEKLAVASQIGATHCVNSDAIDPVGAVREMTGGRGVDHVFEVVGRPQLMAAGIDMLARGGSLTLVGAAGRDEVLSMKPRSFMSKQQLFEPNYEHRGLRAIVAMES